MIMNKRKFIILGILFCLWIASIVFVLAPEIGLSSFVYPRPSLDYALLSLIIMAIILAGYSLKLGLSEIKSLK